MTEREQNALRSLRMPRVLGGFLLRRVLRLLRQQTRPDCGHPDRAHQEESRRIQRSERNGIHNPAPERSPSEPPMPADDEIDIFCVYAGPSLIDADVLPTKIAVGSQSLSRLVAGDEFSWQVFLNIVENRIQRAAP